MANVILLDGEAREEDYDAAATLTPGELVLPGSTEGEITVNATAVDPDAPRWFVREQVENAGAGIDDDIASGDTCTVLKCESGAVVNAWLAYGENVSEGDALESDGAGALQAHTSGRIIAFAGEDNDNTSGGARVRIRAIVA